MKDIVKEFNGVRVLDKVSFSLQRGSVHALIGENGAGKSTLMKILNGIYTKTEGEIFINGEKVSFLEPNDAKKHGIAMIHQEMSAFPELSVSANMFMGRELMNGLVINEKLMDSAARKVFAEFGFDIDPKKKIKDLSNAEVQLVEIAKAVSTDADIIIMDEPTSSLTESEVEKLYKTIGGLRSKKKSVIYISHKLDEIFTICDTITVLRDGALIGTDAAENFTKEKLISMMVGRTLEQQFYKTEHVFGETMLEVCKLADADGKFSDISFNVRKGEILGIAGLVGAGRTEVVETVFGLRKRLCGEIKINGKTVDIRCPRDAIENGIAFVSEDRKLVGLNLIAGIKDNITMANLEEYCRMGVINMTKEKTVADEYMAKLSIKATNRDMQLLNLSGGNQQKVVLARWMSISPQILIVDEPTRGIDVGAKAEIYRLIDRFAAEGNSVVMVSSEMQEILGMSDRIVVLHEGEFTAEFERREATQEKILAAASGV